MSSAQERLRLQEELRDEVAWRTTMLIDEPPDDAPTGRQFDLALLAYISDLLADLEQGWMDIVKCERIIVTVERGFKTDLEFRAFEEDIRKAGQAPLAWRTIFDLAKRRVRRKAHRKANESIPDSQRLPTFSEGKACAEVLLAYDTAKARWKRDLHPDELSEHIAKEWLLLRSLHDLQSLIRRSEESRTWWNALELICDELAGKGVLGGKDLLGRKWKSAKGLDNIPHSLLLWHFEADKGLRRRPPEIAAPPHRPTKAGYMIRDQNIRHTIRVLAQLGMPPTGGHNSGCSVVADVLRPLKERTVREIWKRPDMESDESNAEYFDRRVGTAL